MPTAQPSTWRLHRFRFCSTSARLSYPSSTLMPQSKRQPSDWISSIALIARQQQPPTTNQPSLILDCLRRPQPPKRSATGAALSCSSGGQWHKPDVVPETPHWPTSMPPLHLIQAMQACNGIARRLPVCFPPAEGNKENKSYSKNNYFGSNKFK